MELDKYQKEAVNSNSANTLIIAPPGSGKTTVLLNRIKYLVEEKYVNPNNIIVLTFTKSAALNMKERYLRLANNNESPFFGTFHGLFFKILKRYKGEINIIDPREGYNIILNILNKKLSEVGDEKIKEVFNNISNLKCSNVSLNEFNSTLDKEIFTECYLAYEENKNSKNLLDFDDLQIEFYRLITEDDNIRRGYQRLFKHILVDEFQDCDGMQIEILQNLNCNNSIFAVGDEDQCIYSFRGSKPQCMIDFHKFFVEGEKKYLSYNYRSNRNIVEFSKSSIVNNKMRNDKKFEASKDTLGELEYYTPFNEEEQVNEIISKIKIHLSNNDKLSDNVIIYRTNIEARSLIDGFIRQKIDFSFLDKDYNFFEHFICEDILAYLKLSIDPFDLDAFTRIINKPFRYISKIAIEEVKKGLYKNNLFDELNSVDGIKPFQKKKIEDLKKDIAKLNKMSLKSAIDYILNNLGYNDYLVEYGMKYKINIDEIFQIVDEFKSAAYPFNTIMLLLAHVKETKEKLEDIKKDKNRDAVLFSTIHGVKGREFKNVYFIDLSEDYIPHRSNDNVEEERRLFYNVFILIEINNISNQK
ncbi:ATP-dependent helicase [Inconstantimicrobium mannanitabidum]|uniref:DNA helicase n=1 Tax=Inconstantimicrobium mannanitabidum TaxID=1604901 RepID=A0ACB5RDR2_9CLOT|nr:ATP-dependent helicase [Clostridium sp. TW13]GKX66904.1 DNA helicase [Clostridium sp. TW13]